MHEPFAVAALADDDRAVEILQRSRHDLRCRCRVAVDEHRQRQVREYRFRFGAVYPARIFRAAFGAYHFGAFRDEHPQYLHGLLHDAAAVAAVIEDQPLQFALRTQPFDGCPHILVATFGEIAVADVPDAFVHPSRVGYARNGDPFALQSDGLGASRQVFDGHPDLAARVSLEA